MDRRDKTIKKRKRIEYNMRRKKNETAKLCTYSIIKRF